MTAMPRAAAELLEWAGTDLDRLHAAYQAEAIDKPPPQRRPPVLAELANRLGWPLPDTPAADVLAWAGRPGFPPAQVLARERARPPRWQRPELLAELEARVAGAGDNANAIAPAHASELDHLFR